MRIFFFLLAVLVAQSGQAHEISIHAGGRTYPFGGAAEVRGKYDFLVWDQRSQTAFWKYGFLQAQGAVGTQGLAEGALSFYPVSFLELTGAQSFTNRYYKTERFDCEQLVCQGTLRRDRLTARLIGGAGDWFFVLSGNRIWLSHQNQSQSLVDEMEVLQIRPGGDLLETGSLLFGKRLGDEVLGLAFRQAHSKASGVGNETQSLFYRFPLEAYTMSVGVGRYVSDFASPGISVYALLAWTWGKSLVLF